MILYGCDCLPDRTVPGLGLPAFRPPIDRPADIVLFETRRCVSVEGYAERSYRRGYVHGFRWASFIRARLSWLKSLLDDALDEHRGDLRRWERRAKDGVFHGHETPPLVVRLSLCVYCEKEAEQLDHLIPRSRGGCSCPENLRPVCRRCNLAKGAQDLRTWQGGRFADLLKETHVHRVRIVPAVKPEAEVTSA